MNRNSLLAGVAVIVAGGIAGLLGLSTDILPQWVGILGVFGVVAGVVALIAKM